METRKWEIFMGTWERETFMGVRDLEILVRAWEGEIFTGNWKCEILRGSDNDKSLWKFWNGKSSWEPGNKKFYGKLGTRNLYGSLWALKSLWEPTNEGLIFNCHEVFCCVFFFLLSCLPWGFENSRNRSEFVRICWSKEKRKLRKIQRITRSCWWNNSKWSTN